MTVLAQVPGADEVIKAASRDAGWVAVFLVVIVLAIVGLAGYLVKRILEDSKLREDRMANRINYLEDYIKQTQTKLIEDCTKALVSSVTATQDLTRVVSELRDALHVRPCFWSAEKQHDIIDQLEKKRSGGK